MHYLMDALHLMPRCDEDYKKYEVFNDTGKALT